MLTLATYINILEADKQKLKAQVKRLCAENNWLRKELTDHQQLLQETETSLAKIKEEKEHLGFLLEQQRVRTFALGCNLGPRVGVWVRLGCNLGPMVVGRIALVALLLTLHFLLLTVARERAERTESCHGH